VYRYRKLRETVGLPQGVKGEIAEKEDGRTVNANARLHILATVRCARRYLDISRIREISGIAMPETGRIALFCHSLFPLSPTAEHGAAKSPRARTCLNLSNSIYADMAYPSYGPFNFYRNFPKVNITGISSGLEDPFANSPFRQKWSLSRNKAGSISLVNKWLCIDTDCK